MIHHFELTREIETLVALRDRAEERHERLTAVAHAFEEATWDTQSPAEVEHLDRISAVVERARDQVVRLQARIEVTTALRNELEEQADRRAADRRLRGRARAREQAEAEAIVRARLDAEGEEDYELEQAEKAALRGE